MKRTVLILCTLFSCFSVNAQSSKVDQTLGADKKAGSVYNLEPAKVAIPMPGSTLATTFNPDNIQCNQTFSVNALKDSTVTKPQKAVEFIDKKK